MSIQDLSTSRLTLRKLQQIHFYTEKCKAFRKLFLDNCRNHAYGPNPEKLISNLGDVSVEILYFSPIRVYQVLLIAGILYRIHHLSVLCFGALLAWLQQHPEPNRETRSRTQTVQQNPDNAASLRSRKFKSRDAQQLSSYRMVMRTGR